MSHSGPGEHRSHVSVLVNLVRESLQKHHRQHGAGGRHKATAPGPDQGVHLLAVREHMPFVVREGQAPVFAAALGESVEQAWRDLDASMDVPVDRRRGPRESVR